MELKIIGTRSYAAVGATLAVAPTDSYSLSLPDIQILCRDVLLVGVAVGVDGLGH